MSFFAAAVSTAQDFFGEKLIEKATGTAAAAMNRKELKEQVQALAERYRPQFEALSLKEEFDFEGLNAFLQENLFPRVAACFNAPERETREAAKRLLYASACDRAGANTQAKKDAVRRYLELFLEVVERFFLEQIGDEKWFLCGRAVEEVTQTVSAYLQQQTAQITEAIRYHNSFAEYIDNLQPPVTTTNRFHYRNTELGFYGREQETAALNAFLDRKEQILWTAVVGDGGVGKSKLLYHFCEQASNWPGWKTVWFGTNSSKKVNEYQNWQYPDGLLVVADYAGEMAEQLGDWLAKLAETGENRRPKRLRLILLERENLGDVPPFWYQTFTDGRERRRAVKRFRAEPPSIELLGLGDEALGALVQDYARSEKGRELSQTELSSVLEKAHEIDRDDHDDRNDRDDNDDRNDHDDHDDRNDRAPRPLVTLFIADAVLEGNDYTHWDIPALVENIIERYQDHWRNTVCNGDEKLYDALQQMLVYATATGGWDLTKLPGPLETAAKTLLTSGRVLEPLVCAVNEENTFRERLSPLEPDLVGEFYVLDYLNDLRYDKTTLAAWVRLFWEQWRGFAMFLDRCIRNYCNEPRFRTLFRDGMAVFQPRAEDVLETVFYAVLLVNLTALQSLEEQKSTVDRLELLAELNHDFREITIRYAWGLVNLSIGQSLEDAKETVAKLETLAEQLPKSDEVALAYAKGLFILSCNQSLEETKKAVDKLETLAEMFPASAEITLRYARGLANLSLDQPLEEVTKTVAKLEELAEKRPDSDEIAQEYAVGLVSLSFGQSLEKRKKNVDKLAALHGQYPKSNDIAVTYAFGLSVLLIVQTPKEATKTIAKLEELANQHPDSTEIADLYAKALDDLANRPPQE